MHYLVPQFILDNYRQNNQRGRLFAVCLFVDISGFSTITDSLMKHGPHGAEILADLMRSVFDPLIRGVYEYGGFVATFAGDAFTAVFPEVDESEAGRQDAAQRSIVAAWQIQQRMERVSEQKTPYGDFRVSAKVGLACGDVSWGIVLSEDERRAAYYFQGPAIDGSAQAEHVAQAGEIIFTNKLFDYIEAMVNAEILDASPAEHLRLTNLSIDAPPGQPIGPRVADKQVLTRFFPEAVVNQEHSGEFRQVLNLFISLPTVRTEDQLVIFMKSLFALQDQYGGLLNRIDFGDKGSNLLLFWGAPKSYENDVSRALSFILDLQTSTSIPINAGVTYHIAHAGFAGSPLREEYTCYGRGVNLAARFMTAAPRGEIWLDEGVARRAQRQFEVEFEGEMAFKGFAEEQKVYVLFEVKEDDETFYDKAMVGRQAEVDALTGFVAPIWQNKPAGAVVIWGDPGMGKSRLVHEFHNSDLIKDRGILWALCQSDEILRESFNPFRYWLRRYFNQSDAQSEARNKRNFNRKLDGLVFDLTDPELAAEADRTRSFLGAMMDLYWPDSLYEGLDAQGRYENTMLGLLTLMHAESLRQPLVVQIEDLHWIDEASREFLTRLAQTLRPESDANYPIAIIATSRHEGPGFPQTEGGSVLEIDLARLPHESLADLAREMLGDQVSESLLALVVDRAEGNPFFAEQILRFLQESELLVNGPGGWQVETEQRHPLPADVRSVLIARLDRLAQEVKDIVQTAAVLGREFEVALLSGMLRDDNSVGERVTAAEQAAVWSPLSQMRYLFKHALLRDTAYRMQVRTRRQTLHQLAAEAIETLYSEDLRPHYVELAYHSEQAARDAAAADWYLLAAEQAKSRGTLLDARTYLDRTLALIPAGQTSKRWQALARQIEVLTMLGDAEAGLKEVTAALELAQQSNDDVLVADAYYQRGTIALTMGNDQEAMADLDAGLEASRRCGEQRFEALAQGMMAIALARLGWIEDAGIVAESALAVAEDLGEEDVLVRTLNNLANFYMFAGDFGRAAELLTRQVDINRRQGDRVGEAHGLTNLAYNLLSVGLYEAAQEAIGQALQLTLSMGARRLSVYNRLNLSLAQTRLNRPADARQEIETTRQVLAGIGDNFALAISHTYLGLALETGGQLEQATTTFETAAGLLTDMSAAGYAMDAQSGRCRCALLQDDIPTARRLADEIWEYVQQSGVSGLEFPLMAIGSCARAFESAGDEQTYRAAVEAGYRELMERAEKISDGEWRSAFLHNVPEHHALRLRWQQLAS